MFEENINELIDSENAYSVHLGIVILLVLGALGFPVPEDIPIILAGIAAAQKIVSTQGIFLTCYVSVVIADIFIFMVGWLFGQKLLKAGTKSRFLPVVTEDKVETIREGLRKRRLLYIFIARHLFAVRTLTFLISGALRIPISEFIIADAIAALISVSLMMGLGYFLGETLTPEVINHLVSQASLYLLAAVVIVAAIYLFRKKKKTLQK